MTTAVVMALLCALGQRCTQKLHMDFLKRGTRSIITDSRVRSRPLQLAGVPSSAGGLATAAASDSQHSIVTHSSRLGSSMSDANSQQQDQEQVRSDLLGQQLNIMSDAHNTAVSKQLHSEGSEDRKSRRRHKQQQQQSLDKLWDTAAQLGLKRGSEIDVPASYNNSATEEQQSNSSGIVPLPLRRRRSSTSWISKQDRSDFNSSQSSAYTANALAAAEEGAVVEEATDRDIASACSDISADQQQRSANAELNESSSSSSGAISSFGGHSEEVVAAIARLGRFLDFRERCAAEVKAKLQSLGYDPKLAQDVLTALQRAGLQSDARFAEMFVRTYWKGKAQSPTRLAYELRTRGVAQQHIDAAMTAVFGPTQQLPMRDQETHEQDEVWEHLVEVCRRRAELTRTEPQQKRRAKLANWLQRRGHTMSTIFRIFKEVGL